MSGQDDSVTLHQVVDVLVLRSEQTDDLEEYQALVEALRVIEDYALREQRTLGWIERILERISGYRKDYAA